MVARNDPAAPAEKGTFRLTRVFNAPRELVWKAFTEPARLNQWWGPKGFTVKSAEVDLRVGGTFRYCLEAPGGAFTMCGRWVYRELEAPERMVSISSFTDENWNPIRHPMEPTWPLETLSTMILTEKDGKTTATLTAVAYNATDAERATFEAGLDSMDEGFKGTLDQLDAYLAQAQA